MCLSSHANHNQHACLISDSLLSTTMPVAKELASIHTVSSCPFTLQSPWAGSFCTNHAIISDSIWIRSGSYVCCPSLLSQSLHAASWMWLWCGASHTLEDVPSNSHTEKRCFDKWVHQATLEAHPSDTIVISYASPWHVNLVREYRPSAVPDSCMSIQIVGDGPSHMQQCTCSHWQIYHQYMKT